MKFPFKKTVSKDYLLFSSIILLITFIYTVLFAFFIYENQSQNLDEKSQVKANQIGKEITYKLDEVYRYAEFIAEKINQKISLQKYDEINEILTRNRSLRISAQLDNTIQWSSFGFKDKNGKIYYKGNNPIESYDKKLDTLYNFAESKNNSWQLKFHKPVILGKYKNYYALPISYGITNNQGRYIGALFSLIFFDKITEDIASLINDKNIYFSVFTKDNLAISDLVRPMSDLSSKPEDIIFNYSESLTKYPFYVKVGYNKQASLNNFYKSIVTQFSELILLSFIILFVMYLFYQRFVSPIISLSKVAKKISEEKEVNVPESLYSDEFNNMEKALRKIESYKRQILVSNDDLLQKTQDLEKTRIHLERIIRSSQDSDDTKSRIIKEIRYGTQSAMKSITSSLDIIIKSLSGENELKLSDEKILLLIKNIYSELENIRTFTTESLNETVIDISEIVKQSLTLNQKEVQNKRVILSTSIDDNLGNLYADKTRLYQIINSLIHRSLDFLTEGNRLDIKCHKELEEKNNQYNFVLVISDNGYGISESKRRELSKNLNRDFFEGIDLTTDAIKKLVELHLGSIEIKDEWKKGSTMKLKIPYRNQHDKYKEYIIGNPTNVISLSHWKKGS